jgi:hypothetical protein
MIFQLRHRLVVGARAQPPVGSALHKRCWIFIEPRMEVGSELSVSIRRLPRPGPRSSTPRSRLVNGAS